ncbi:MAG TPA: OmpA family protein [Terriglobales bacterium]|nr:OmpA family protein [Terriglobales bacterium]
MRPAQAYADQAGTIPLYRVDVVGSTVTTVNFHVLGDETSLQLRGTPLLPFAKGKADVQIKRGATDVHMQVDKVNPAQRFGGEYLTYVLWAITPDGRAKNLGEVQLNGQSASMQVTTTLQDFGLIVTAEPYFGVTRPSDLVVMEGYVTPNTVGAQAMVKAKYQLLRRGGYALHVDPAQVTTLPQDPKVPLDLYEAENAVRIARWAGADRYAPAIYKKASAQLQQAEDYQARNAGKTPVASVAREAVQTAEDARLLTLQRRQQARRATIAANAQERTAQAQADAQAAQQHSAEADAAKQRAQAGQQAATQAAAQAEAATADAQAAQREAEANTQTAQQQERQARARLLAQLNSVMTTRDTATGLIMSMPDVLFDFNQATLRPNAQVKLAKTAGILLSYPGLTIQVNGYTDSTGTLAYNQTLSEQRASAVQSFLASQGVSPSAIASQGFGEADPAASNATASGRQQNRRVDLVVNGNAIGTPSLPN